MVGTNLIKSIPGVGAASHTFLLGGERIGAPALLRFYTWHVLALVFVASALVTWHIFRVRRDGGISHRESAPRVGRAQLVRLEIVTTLLTLAALLSLGLLVNAPLGPPADPSALIGEPKAPWFFLWIQELLRVAPPFLAGILVPIAILIILGLLPYTLDRSPEGVAVWFNQQGRVAQLVFLIILVGAIALTLRGAIR
jgi:quinol-cytochrome oxidoreductase complex cytochrome b subunit